MEEVKKRKNDLRKFAPVVCLLSYEIVAFIAFSLAQSFLLYGILSLVLLVLLFFVTKGEIDKEGYSNYLFFAFPILIFGTLSALSYFNSGDYVDTYKLAIRIFMPICLASLGLCGAFVSKAQGFKVRNLLLFFYGALALYCAINLIVTMVQFVPFYTITYKDYVVYYNGKPSPSPIGETAYVLMGFSMESVSVNYFSFFPSVLLTSVIALFFVKPKEEKKVFIAYALYAFIAFLSLLFTPTKMTLMTDVFMVAVILLAVLVGKKIIKPESMNKTMKVLGIIFLVGLLFVILNAQSSIGFLQKITTSNKFFNRLFHTNRVISPINDVLDGLFSTNKLFGFPPYYDEVKFHNVWPSGGWISDFFMTSGIFGYAFFIFVLISGYKAFVKYFKNDSKDTSIQKLILISIVISTLLYTIFNYDAKPFVYGNEVSNLLIRGPFTLIFFLIGYIYAKGNDKAKAMEEDKNEIEEVTVGE